MSFWDDKIKHLDPQIGSQYDLIALSSGVRSDPAIYDAVRYVARTLKEEMHFNGMWIAPHVELFEEQPDTTKPGFGWNMVLHLTLSQRNAGAREVPYTVNALLRRVAEEWFLVKSVQSYTGEVVELIR